MSENWNHDRIHLLHGPTGVCFTIRLCVQGEFNGGARSTRAVFCNARERLENENVCYGKLFGFGSALAMLSAF